MSRVSGKRYWLVGASEGLGRALAQAMAARGARLVLSARNADRLADLAASLPGTHEVQACDVASAASVQAAADAIGPVDGVVWLAGVYWPMSAADWDPDKAEAMCDINLTGCARVLGRVVPGMVARGSGHVVIVGSLAAFRGLPGAIGYAASKAGTMVLAESLQADLHRTGVRVQLANPGFIRTRLTEKNDFSMPQLMEPDQAAAEVMTLMEGNRFSRSFPVPFAWVFRLGNLMPDRLYFRLFGAK